MMREPPLGWFDILIAIAIAVVGVCWVTLWYVLATSQ